MGIGTGYLKPEYAAVGVPFAERGALTDEAIKLMRMAWTGEPVTHVSQYCEAWDTCVRPTPVQAPLPIWAGGNSNRAIRRAVELCEGWCPFPVSGAVSATTRTEELSNFEQLRDKLRFASELAEQVGRTAPLQVCMSLFGQHAMKSGDSAAAAALIDGYSTLLEAGVSWTTVSLPAPSLAAFLENVQWFGEEVVARVPGRQVS